MLSTSCINHGHSPDWAAEVISLDENYNISASTGVGLFLLFNCDTDYINLNKNERQAIIMHEAYQSIPY